MNFFGAFRKNTGKNMLGGFLASFAPVNGAKIGGRSRKNRSRKNRSRKNRSRKNRRTNW